MPRSTPLAIFAAFLSVSQPSVSAPWSYTCEVKHVYSLTDDAALGTSGFEKTMKGGNFSVSREGGEIVGEVVSTLGAKATRVVNRGSTENSFKTVADFDGQIQILEVQEFQKGMIKPFIAMSMGGAGVITGTCK